MIKVIGSTFIIIGLVLPATSAYANKSELVSPLGSGTGIYKQISLSTANLFMLDADLSDKEKALKAKKESCNDLILSAEQLAAKKVGEEIVSRAKSQCIDKLGSVNLDIKIPSLFDMLLNAAKKRILDEIDKACSKVNNAIGSTTLFTVGGSAFGQQVGVSGGVVTGNGSNSGYVPPKSTTPVWQGNTGVNSNIPGVKF